MLLDGALSLFVSREEVVLTTDTAGSVRCDSFSSDPFLTVTLATGLLRPLFHSAMGRYYCGGFGLVVVQVCSSR